MFSLKSKLIAGFAALLGVAVIVGAIGFSVVNSYSQALTKILRENYDSIVYCEGMQRALAEYRGIALDYAVAGQSAKSNRTGAIEARFDSFLFKELGNLTLPGEGDSARKIERLWTQLKAEFSIYSDAGLSDSLRIVSFHTQIIPKMEPIQAMVQSVSDMNLSNMVSVDGQAQSRAQEAKRITYVLIVTGTLLALLLITVTGRAILQPLRMLTQSIREIQRGNLNLVIESRYRDEVGQLVEAFNDMAAELRYLKLGDQAKLARSQQSAQLVLDSLPDAVVVTAPDATVELANSAARKLMGVVPGGSIYDTSPEWHQSLKQNEEIERIDSDKHDRMVQVFVDGKEKYFLPRILPIKDAAGLPVGLIVVFLDVTRMRRVTELENDLVATVSHELKTPLTSVRMALHMLTDERVGALNAQQMELLLAAKNDSERLFTIIRDLLDVARYQAGNSTIELSPVSPRMLVTKAYEAALADYRKAGVNIRIKIPEEISDVLGNAARLAHVFGNLLANALRYSAPGGEVIVSAVEVEGKVEFSVSDNGSGIPEDELPHVFDRFYRGKLDEDSVGAGLGLTIAKEIIEAHGGTIRASSQVGQGTTFFFTLRESNT